MASASREPDSELNAIRELVRPGQDTDAFPGARKLAESGVREAQVLLAWMYHAGRGVERDFDQAEAWYLKAIEPGCGDAEFYLSALHRQRGDWVRTLEWLERSSANGFPAAPYEIGRMYLFGLGVERNRQRAFEYFEDAASKGHLFACRNIAHEMMSGRRGVRQIPLGLIRLFRTACEGFRLGPNSEFLLRL